MRLGVHVPQFRAPVSGAVLAEAAAAAEEAGADDLWVSDHLILPAGSERPPESFHDALTVLAWVAATTRHAGLGTSVLVAPYRHPVALAKSLASLDALSGGRVIAGLASGWHAAEFAALGVPHARRGALTDEAVTVCRGLWAGRTDVRTATVDATGMRLSPGPARPGGPPIWVGGDSSAGIRRAAAAGDGWHTTVGHASRLAPLLDALDRELEARGRSRADGFTLSVRVRATPRRVAELAPPLRRLGVDHLLVDPPAFTGPEALAREVAELRALL